MSCRLCQKIFDLGKTSRESRINIYKRKLDNSSIFSRLTSIGITLKKEIGKSELICRPCETKVAVLEKSKGIRESWGIQNENNDEEPNDIQVNKAFFNARFILSLIHI